MLVPIQLIDEDFEVELVALLRLDHDIEKLLHAKSKCHCADNIDTNADDSKASFDLNSPVKFARRPLRRITPRLTGAGARSAKGTNTGHENGEAMASVGVQVQPLVRLRRVVEERFS